MRYTLHLIFALSMCFIACGGDDDPVANCNSQGFVIEYEDEIAAIGTATNAWLMDQSQANCDALKDAYTAYLNVLDAWEDCANQLGEAEEWQQAIDEAQASVNTIC